MARCAAHSAKVAGSITDAFAKVIMPNSIYDTSPGERILLMSQPVCQCRPSFGFIVGICNANELANVRTPTMLLVGTELCAARQNRRCSSERLWERPTTWLGLGLRRWHVDGRCCGINKIWGGSFLNPRHWPSIVVHGSPEPIAVPPYAMHLEY